MVLGRIPAAAIVLVGTLSLASPVDAGGSVWDVDPEPAAPGDQVEAWTGVSWAHNPSLGTPEDGPFYAWLVPAHLDDEGGLSMHYGPPVPEGAVLLGEITVAADPYRGWGPNSARITFTMPDVAPGEYEIFHCNDPCTTSFGDITFGYLTVTGPNGELAPPPPTPSTTTTVAAPTTTTVVRKTTGPPTGTGSGESVDDLAANEAVLVSVSSDGPSGTVNSAAWWVGGALGLIALSGWIAVRQRRTHPG